MTASPEKLVFMMYDKAIGSLKEAVRAIEDNDIERRWKSNKKAFEIISHMWQTLDMENGGEISQNLDKLFSYILNRLPNVDFNNDPQPAIDAIKLLEPLHASWKQLSMEAAKGKATPAPQGQSQSQAYNQTSKSDSQEETKPSSDLLEGTVSVSA